MIELRNISFAYEGCKKSLQNINLKIKSNECVVLIACSGNGKTTLTRIINGLAGTHFKGILDGDVLIDGKNVGSMPLWERSKLVGSVFQDPKSQFFSNELTGEIAFGLENYGFKAKIVRERTDEIILNTNLNLIQNYPLDALSSGEKQKTAIASVQVLQPDIYVFDEPTANLDEQASFSLAQTIKHLKTNGHTLIIAEHRLSYLSDIADRYIYIKNGKIDADYTAVQLRDLSEEKKKILGIRSLKKVNRITLPQIGITTKEMKMKVDNLTIERGKNVIAKNVSFSVEKGQIVAITGKNGIGKTSIAKTMCGIFKEKKGGIYIDDKKISSRNRYKYVWYSSNDTHTQFFTNSLTEELLLLTDKSDEKLENARNILKFLGLYEYKEVHPAVMSGGQKQRLSIACGILSDREILIFDEPTSGLDGKNLRLVSHVFKKIAESGKTVFIITHDNELIQECCTHLFEIQ